LLSVLGAALHGGFPGVQRLSHDCVLILARFMPLLQESLERSLGRP
jgi:hypothetical protein